MITVNGYKSYYGGKSGSGTYQTLINHIPPHDVFMSLFLGNCGVTRHIRPARLSLLNDIDYNIINAWGECMLPESYRLCNVSAIEHLKAYDIAEKYDTAETFIFLDPPYIIETRKQQKPVYRFEMSETDHVKLLDVVLKWQHAKFMICAYPNELYDNALVGWHTFDFYSKTRNGMALERVYCNYELGDTLHDYSYIGKTFRQREQLTRIKNNCISKLKRLDPILRNSILEDLASHKW